MIEPTLRLSVPPEGIRAGEVVLRSPSLGDVDAILPAFTDPELREAGNLPAFTRDDHAFSLGIERVAAYVNVGNTASERVVERAGFTREGVVRSLPKPDGWRIDKTLFSLLPGE